MAHPTILKDSLPFFEPWTYLPHIIFFALRIICFAILISFSFTTSVDACCTKESADDFLYVGQYNLFQFYLTISSLTTGNIFGYRLSIALMIHSTILSIFIPASTSAKLTTRSWIISSFISALFFFEAIFSIYHEYLNRHENKYQLFKKIGPDPGLNDAFSSRKCLETFGWINVFVASAISGKMYLLPFSKFNRYSAIVFANTILTYVQQIFITVRFNEESVLQRKIAIWLSVTKLPLEVLGIVVFVVEPKNYKDCSISVDIFLFGDSLLLTTLMIYFLWSDTKKFGKGLKEYFKFKAKKLNLS